MYIQLDEPPELAHTDEWHRFKREIYQQTFGVIFGKTKEVAKMGGEVMRCGDEKKRIIIPGVPIDSMDMEEMWCFTACRSVHAKFPCPRCLVPNAEQHIYSKTYPLRTSSSMKKTYDDAKEAKTKAEANQLLMDCGLNDVKVQYSIFTTCYPTLLMQQIELLLGFPKLRPISRCFIRHTSFR
jgi:hypothetical protein